MVGPSVTLRCPQCGGLLAAPTPVGPLPGWFQCPHCGRPLPVVPPRDPAPLFSWEAFPQLYPAAHPPRPIGPLVQRVGGGLLIGITVVLLILAGGLFSQGAAALPGHSYVVAGHVTAAPGVGSPAGPVSGARVNLTGEDGFSAVTYTAPNGAFRVGGVPTGEITINVTAVGFSPLVMELFASRPYSAPASVSDLALQISAGNDSTSTIEVLTPFSSLENFLATLWSGTAVLGLAAVVSAAGAVRLLGRERLAYGVAGGMAGALAPIVLYTLGVAGMFSWMTDLAVAVGLAGLTATVLLGGLLATTSVPDVPDGR